MISVEFPEIFVKLGFVTQSEVEEKGYEILNDDEDVLDIVIPEDYEDLSQNGKLDCLVILKEILEDINNRYETIEDKNQLIRLTINEKYNLYILKNFEGLHFSRFRLRFSSFFEDFQAAYRCAMYLLDDFD